MNKQNEYINKYSNIIGRVEELCKNAGIITEVWFSEWEFRLCFKFLKNGCFGQIKVDEETITDETYVYIERYLKENFGEK